MRNFIVGGVLLIAHQCFSQTSMKTQATEVSSLDQYVWDFSKNKAVPNAKKWIDFDAIDGWRGLGFYLAVSNDGNYFAYTMNKMAYGRGGLFIKDSLIIQSTQSDRRAVFTGAETGFFATNNIQYIFQDGTNLCFLSLRDMQQKVVKDVVSYKVAQNEWLGYQLKGSDTLMLKNLRTRKEKQFAEIKEYEFDNSSTWLACKNRNHELLLYNLATARDKRFSAIINYAWSPNGEALLLQDAGALKYVNLRQGDPMTIWETKEKTSVGSYSLDGTGKRVLFTIVDSADTNNSGIWYYEPGMNKAVLKVSNQTEGIPAGLIIKDVSFASNGSYLIVSLKANPELVNKPDDKMPGVEIWNTKDINLQSAQAELIKDTKKYKAIVNIESGKTVFVETDSKKIFLSQGEFAVVKKDYQTEYGDRFWEKGEDSTWVVSLRDGSDHLLPTKSDRCWFSPRGNYLVYFDNSKGCHYYSYDLHTGELKDMTAGVETDRLGIIDQGNEEAPKSGNLAAWIEKDAGVLVYDNYDIWQLDLAGKKPAVNITNGVGVSNKTVLNLFTTDHYSYEIPVIKATENLLLRGYNRATKESGFYRKNMAGTRPPEKVFMGKYFMNMIVGCHALNSSNMGLAPVKAKNRNSWIVQRQSADDAPNYYETKDFKNFRRLTNFQPQKNYQWFTEELVAFKHLDGKTGQGILYKPENFDPTQKYPVMICLYENFSDNMYQFPVPFGNMMAISPAQSPQWLLNNGYLVFTPDIVVTHLKYGPKAYSVIEGAANYLKAIPYVDVNGLGYAAHSWSAQLGSYLFTHSTSFSASAISEGYGFANPINSALSSKNGRSDLDGFETGREYGNLWQNKSSWLDQTTVLNLDKSKFPLLLFCNKESSADYQDQTFQFFNALRRLDKNVLWLKYDNGSHILDDPKEIKDYTIRYTQFFDHNLKNAPAPGWMTQGIPLKLKGIESRYELDPQGRCNPQHGEQCLICEAWNKQYAKTPDRFRKEIKDWALDKDIADELAQKQRERREELDKEGEIRTKEVLKMLAK